MKKLIYEDDYDKIYCCGDLHGMYDQFIQELNNINFNFKKDLIICTGDLVDRGNQSKECLELLLQPWFKSVRGNHEQFIINYIESIANSDNKDFNKDFHIVNGGSWYYDTLTEDQQDFYYELIKINMPLVYQLVDFNVAIIHAEFPHLLNDWNYLDSALTEFNESFLWARKRIYDSQYPAIKNINKIYAGHTYVEKEHISHNLHYIDTHFYRTGKLTIIQLK